MSCLLPPSAVMRRRVRCEVDTRSVLGLKYINKVLVLSLLVCWFLFCVFTLIEMIFMTMVALLTVSRSFKDISLTSVALPLERVAARVCQRRGYVMFACSEWMTITGTTCCRHHFGFSMQAQPCTRNATVFAHRSGRLCEVSRASRTTIPLGLLVMTLLFHWRPHCTVFFSRTLFCDQYERGPSAAASYGPMAR